jgi:hypothetical protein
MTIEQLDKVDKVYVEDATGKAVVVIIDHLPWEIDEGRHLELLQAKVYRQLDGIESGELYRRVAMTDGRPFAIAIYSRFPLSRHGRNLVDNLTRYLAGMGVELRWILFDPKATPINQIPRDS